MVTKLAPTRLVGLGMGGWFLSTGIGNNLSGIFASAVSGESGMACVGIQRTRARNAVECSTHLTGFRPGGVRALRAAGNTPMPLV